MRPEPIYEYVKGKGWVANSNNILTMRCGTEVYWEVRLPERNESYIKFVNILPVNVLPERIKQNSFPRTRARQTPEYYERMALRHHIVIVHRVSDTPHNPDH